MIIAILILNMNIQLEIVDPIIILIIGFNNSVRIKFLFGLFMVITLVVIMIILEFMLERLRYH